MIAYCIYYGNKYDYSNVTNLQKEFKKYNVKVFIKRLDKIPNSVTGNKYFKLKYNILQAKKNSCKQIITFGGAFSNHVLATTIISKENNLKSIAFIRGEETLPLNSTLKIL